MGHVRLSSIKLALIHLLSVMKKSSLTSIVRKTLHRDSRRLLWDEVKSLLKSQAVITRGAWVPDSRLDFPISSRAIARPLEVCFVVHCFFPEYVLRTIELVRKYGKLQPNVDFYVSSPNSEIVGTIQAELAGATNLRGVVLTPNRGRNFGPLLVEFSGAVRKYDYLVHLHSKRSTHTVRALAHLWSEISWKCLAEDELFFDSFLQYFRAKNDIAIGYPTLDNLFFAGQGSSWGTAPSTAIHAAVAEFSNSSSATADRFPFPVGGMFFLRTSAYQAVFNRLWSYTDFPEELGQEDGELQHLIERMFGYIPYVGGLHQIVYHQRLETASLDTSFAD